MFRKVDVPVLGIIENMSAFQMSQLRSESHIFGHGGAREEAERLGVEFLGEIPLHIDIRTTSDGGQPIVASQPSSDHAASVAFPIGFGQNSTAGRAMPRDRDRVGAATCFAGSA